MLITDRRAWKIQTVNLHAPVPFIRAHFITFDMMCDITFSSGQGVQNTKMLRHLFDIQPEAAKLAIFMKKWFSLNSFAFKNYNVVLLTLFYLQKSGFLPAITLVNKLCPHKIFINSEFKINFQCILVKFFSFKTMKYNLINLLACEITIVTGSLTLLAA